MLDRADRIAKNRAALVDLGPPLYVPAGAFPNWKVTGHGASAGPSGHMRTNLIHVTSYASERPWHQVRVDTSVDRRAETPSSMLHRLLPRVVPHDISFPWSVTATEDDALVRVDDASIPARLISIDRWWIASLTIGDRSIVVEADEIPVEAVRLERVDSVEALADSRFAP